MNKIKSKGDVEKLIDEIGFLPFFKSEIPGFSIEEHIAPRFWFSGEIGAWEWKGEIIRDGYIYGKIFGKKSGFATVKWYKQLANWRRNGYDFDSRNDDGLVPFQDLHLYNSLVSFNRILSKGLKSVAGFDKAGGRKGFDTIITRLQMQCYVCIADFPYLTDKHGNEYGWGITEYSTPEYLYGKAFSKNLYKIEPEESREKIFLHLSKIFPNASEAAIYKMIGQK
ncbi:MAG: hypothetical protein IJR49_00600 [Treponema sp.]|nr:hypothetical protein [Treponema sp.]